MSDENKLAVIEEPTTDLTPRDLEVITEYVEAGLPAVTSIDEIKMVRILDMYLSGRTYRQIGLTMSVPRQIILYLSHKFNWFQLRQDYLIDLDTNSKARVLEAKIMNQDMLMQLQQMWRKKIGSNINKYLATDNVDFANAIDLKEVDKYLKTVEMLHRLGSERVPGQPNPTVGLNLGDGVTITKKSDNEVEITPKNKAIGDMLKQMADMQRELNKPK
jgi:hypothetical protein